MIKKNLIALTLAAAFAASAASAQTGAALLEKGKGHEAKKEYVYALGCYYDAMKAQDAPDEAKKNFDALGAKLRQGSAGLGLSMWDDPNEHWQRVIKDFYKYFTEYAPYEFAHDGLRRGELNYANKTASYLMDYSVSLTGKFYRIAGILTDGEDKESKKFHDTNGAITGNTKIPKADLSFQDCWQKYYDQGIKLSDKDYRTQIAKLRNSLLTDIYDKAVKTYKQDGIALSAYVGPAVCDYFDYISFHLDNSYSGTSLTTLYMLKDGLPPSYLAYNLAGVYSGRSFNIPLNGYELEEAIAKYLPYDLEFSIYDSDGKLLAKGTRQGAQAQKQSNEASTYVFSGLPEQTMNVIDSGQYTVRLTGAYLMYGVYYHTYTGNRKDLQNPSLHNELVKKTAEIALDLNKVSVVSKQTAQQGIYQLNYSLIEERIRDWEAKYVEKFKSLGISMSLGISIGTDLVISVTKDSPADKAGYKTGWKVLTKPEAEELARILRRSEQQNAQQAAAQLEKYWSIGPGLTQQVMDNILKYDRLPERILSDKEIENCVQSALMSKAYLFIHDNAYYYYWYGGGNIQLPITDGKKINFVALPGLRSAL